MYFPIDKDTAARPPTKWVSWQSMPCRYQLSVKDQPSYPPASTPEKDLGQEIPEAKSPTGPAAGKESIFKAPYFPSRSFRLSTAKTKVRQTAKVRGPTPLDIPASPVPKDRDTAAYYGLKVREIDDLKLKDFLSYLSSRRRSSAAAGIRDSPKAGERDLPKLGPRSAAILEYHHHITDWTGKKSADKRAQTAAVRDYLHRNKLGDTTLPRVASLPDADCSVVSKEYLAAQSRRGILKIREERAATSTEQHLCNAATDGGKKTKVRFQVAFPQKEPEEPSSAMALRVRQLSSGRIKQRTFMPPLKV